MDSQETLVAAPTSSSPEFLLFWSNTLKDTKVSLSTSPHTAAYVIKTDKGDHKTEIRDARTQRLVASIRRKEFLPDTITFEKDGEQVKTKVGKWLSKTKAPDGYPLHFITDTPGSSCYWRSGRIHRLALYNKDLEDDAPIATYDYPIERGSATKIHLTQPQIAEPLELLEKIIPSFLILETRMRIHEKEDYVGQGRKVFVSNEAGILLGIRPR